MPVSDPGSFMAAPKLPSVPKAAPYASNGSQLRSGTLAGTGALGSVAPYSSPGSALRSGAAPATTTTPTTTTSTTPQAGTATSYLTDPGYLAALASQQQGNADASSLLGKGLSSLFTQFGSPGLASLLSQYGYSLTPDDAAAAQANYNAGTATLAQLDQANQLSQQKSINTLAAHGLADSGDLGYQLKQDATTYGDNVSNAENQLLSQAYGLQANALGERSQQQQNVTSALQQAWNNFVTNPQLYTQPTDTTSSSSGTPTATTSAAATTPATPALTAPTSKKAAVTVLKGGGKTAIQSNAGLLGKKPLF